MLEERSLKGGLEPGMASPDDDDIVSFLEAGEPGHRAPCPASGGI